MRSSIVPAQVTTYEDKVTDRLSVTQLVLIMAPLFLGGLIFVIAPPTFAYAPYKAILIIFIVALFGSLAIRIRGQIALTWAVLLLRYNVRPRYFVYNKNHMHGRYSYIKQPAQAKIVEKERRTLPDIPRLATEEIVKVQKVISDPRAGFQLKTDRKGRLRVHVTEIK